MLVHTLKIVGFFREIEMGKFFILMDGLNKPPYFAMETTKHESEYFLKVFSTTQPRSYLNWV